MKNKRSGQLDYVEYFVTGHGIEFKPPNQHKDIEKRAEEKWKNIFDDLKLTLSSVVLVCGAQNNGKSSLLRSFIDHSLQETFRPQGLRKRKKLADDSLHRRVEFVYYMDCDPGQPELTSPGLISAHLIRSTLLRPQYLNVGRHQEIAISSVAGINMNVDPMVYVNNCAYVYEKVQHQRYSRRGPLFINTMGWVKNIGAAMLIDLIKITCPTHVVVLNVSTDDQRVLYANLDPQVLGSSPFSFYDYKLTNLNRGGELKCEQRLRHSVNVYNLDFAFRDSREIARLNRNASQLAYMSNIAEAMYMPIVKIPPKRIDLNKVSVYCCASYPLKSRIVLELLPRSWVHLCQLQTNFSADQCDFRNSVDQALDEIDNYPVQEESERNYKKKLCVEKENQVKVLSSLKTNLVIGCGFLVFVDVQSHSAYVVTPLDQETLNTEIDCIVKPLGIPFAPEANLSYQDNEFYDQTLVINPEITV